MFQQGDPVKPRSSDYLSLKTFRKEKFYEGTQNEFEIEFEDNALNLMLKKYIHIATKKQREIIGISFA